MLGGSVYMDVEERMPLGVRGSTVDEVLANLATLSEVLDYANRWRNGEDVTPTRIYYRPNMSTASDALLAVVTEFLGITLPSDFDLIDMPRDGGYFLLPVMVNFRRRGSWLEGTETQTAASAAEYPVVQSVTFADDTAVASPCDINMIMSTAGGGVDTLSITLGTDDTILIVTNSTSRLSHVEAESMTATGWTSVADGANNASSTNVLRYTPSATTESISGIASMGLTSTHKAALFFHARNNSGTTTFTVQMEANTSLRSKSRTRPVLIDANAGPRWYFAGFLSGGVNISLSTVAFAVTASAASGTLDIDDFVALSVDDDDYRIIGVNTTGLESTSDDPYTLQVEHLLNSRITSRVSFDESTLGINIPVPSSGNSLVELSGDTVAAILLASDGTDWRIEDSAAAVIENKLQVVRRRAWLVPQ